MPQANAQALVQPPQGWAQQPQGPVMSHYHLPGMSRHLHPIRSSHLLQHYPAQFQNLPQTLAQQQQGMQQPPRAASQQPNMVSADPNIPSFFQPHLAPPGSEQLYPVAPPGWGPLGAAPQPGYIPAQAPYAPPVPYGYATVPVSYNVAGSGAATSSTQGMSAPQLLSPTAVPLNQVSTSVTPATSDAAAATGSQGLPSQAGAVLQLGMQTGAAMQPGYGVYPQYGGPVQQQSGLLHDYQMGFGYLMTVPQLPHGVMYQQV